MNNPIYSGPGGARRPTHAAPAAANSTSFLERLGAWRSASAAGRAAPAPAAPRSSRRLVICATRKGGVGKSFFLASLTDWYREKDIPFIAIDSDWCNGSLTRFVPESLFLDVAGGNTLEEINAALGECPVGLMDGLGPLHGYLFDWLQDNNFFQGFQEPVQLTYVLIVEEDKDSVFQAAEAVAALGDTGQWLVVRNLKTCPTTEIYNSSDARQELLRHGAVEIQMDRVPWNLLLHIQRSGKTIGSLVDDTSLAFLERQRMRSYLAKFYEQVDTAQHLLLPAHLVRHAVPAAPPPPPPPPEGTRPPSARPRVAPDRV